MPEPISLTERQILTTLAQKPQGYTSYSLAQYPEPTRLALSQALQGLERSGLIAGELRPSRERDTSGQVLDAVVQITPAGLAALAAQDA